MVYQKQHNQQYIYIHQLLEVERVNIKKKHYHSKKEVSEKLKLITDYTI